MTSLFILNDPPYGTERTYNGLRLALALLKGDADDEVMVFLMADAVVAARRHGDPRDPRARLFRPDPCLLDTGRGWVRQPRRRDAFLRAAGNRARRLASLPRLRPADRRLAGPHSPR
ncbi:MAG: hypothetical protein FJX65_15560 [Alphaproteobacteria bacterium]|nr:hypothetical protein [Alphaproteobacteria bacterium]